MFVAALFSSAGLSKQRANIVAEVLVEGDLMGHSTHGLQLVPRHLDALKNGAIAHHGDPTIIADSDSSFTWDGCYLPGPWLVREAMNVAFERITKSPVVTAVIRRAGHIGCLAAYPRLAAERNLIMLLASSDPAVRIVAPAGSSEPRYTPNPIAAGWPTRGEPVVVDTCPSTTTAGMVARTKLSNQRLNGPWLIDASGIATDDPDALTRNGAILPLGGTELGHKGFALGLIVEVLTSALSGFGRADLVDQDGAAVFLQLINPDSFGGLSRFIREAQWLVDSCRSAAPIPGGPGVRMPGERGLELRKQQISAGVTLRPETVSALRRLADEFGVAMPPALGEVDADAIA
jgi:LDH2 family malate/lactate/ureidoglycolate dehydrogenase